MKHRMTNLHRMANLRRLGLALTLTLSPCFLVYGDVPAPEPELYQKETYTPPLKWNNQMYLGLGTELGQSRRLGRGGPVAAVKGDLEIGYIKAMSLWSHIEPSLQVVSGTIGYNDAAMTLKYGVLARLGYGYSLGQSMRGVIRFGAGMGFASFEQDDVDGVKFKAKDTLGGTIVQLGYDIIIPVNETMHINAGLAVNSYGFSVGEVERADGTKKRINESITLSTMAIALGVRWLL